ncbi:MAG TPA: hypothetical protein VGF24_12100 [Vicinamibacterales bacterium]
MRYLLAVLLLVHGVAHLPGFLVAYGKASFPEVPYRTTVFGALDIGATGARAIGLAWLALSFSFVALAAVLALRLNVTPMMFPAVLGMSALLCAAEWPEARLGFVANTVIAALLVVAERYDAF